MPFTARAAATAQGHARPVPAGCAAAQRRWEKRGRGGGTRQDRHRTRRRPPEGRKPARAAGRHGRRLRRATATPDPPRAATAPTEMARRRAAPREPGLERPPAGELLRVSQGSATPASAATSPPHRRRRPLRPRRAARGGPDPPRPPPGLGAPPPEQPLPYEGCRSRRRCIWQQLPPWIPPRASFLLRVPSAAPPRASLLLRVAAGGPLPLAPAGRARPRSSSPPLKRAGHAAAEAEAPTPAEAPVE